MSNVHERSVLQKLAEHQLRLAKSGVARRATFAKGKKLFSKLFSKVSKADGMDEFTDLEDWFDELLEQQDDTNDAHTDAGEFFVECAKTCKAMEDADLNKLVPDAISSVTPGHPEYRAVPRTGQPNVPEMSPVPIEFEKLVAFEDF